MWREGRRGGWKKGELFTLFNFDFEFSVCSHCKVQTWSSSAWRGEVYSCFSCLLTLSAV